MKCTAIVERCKDTGLYAGYVPGFAGAHSQGETLDELNKNLKEVIAMLLEDGDPEAERGHDETSSPFIPEKTVIGLLNVPAYKVASVRAARSRKRLPISGRP